MKRNLISMNDLTFDEIDKYLSLAQQVDSLPPEEKLALLKGRILAVLFYEPSTRTRLSFESAMYRLGGNVLGFSESFSTSVAKGESLADTVRTIEQYADVMVIRHPRDGAARLAADCTRIPVINAGDGTNQHPTQTLLDLLTIRKLFGHIDGLSIAFAGDLKYSRTVHSLIQALLKFKNVSFTLVSPESLRLPAYLKPPPPSSAFRETSDILDAIHSCDLVYMTRIQKERFADLVEFEKVKNSYCIDAAMLASAPDHLRVLHPLPRVNEIATSVDTTPHAAYFQQVGAGVAIRQAVLLDLLEVRT